MSKISPDFPVFSDLIAFITSSPVTRIKSLLLWHMSTISLNSSSTNLLYSLSYEGLSFGVASCLKCWCHPDRISPSFLNVLSPTCSSLTQLTSFPLCLFMSLWNNFELCVLDSRISCLICTCLLLYSNRMVWRRAIVVSFLLRTIWSVPFFGLPACFHSYKALFFSSTSFCMSGVQTFNRDVLFLCFFLFGAAFIAASFKILLTFLTSCPNHIDYQHQCLCWGWTPQ